MLEGSEIVRNDGTRAPARGGGEGDSVSGGVLSDIAGGVSGAVVIMAGDKAEGEEVEGLSRSSTGDAGAAG